MKKNAQTGGKIKTFVADGPAGLAEFLQASMPDKSRKTILSLLAHHQVSVDNRIATHYNHRLEKGQRVVVNPGKVLQGSRDKGLKIVYEDAYLVIVEKPYGLLTIATDKENHRTAFRMLNDQAKKIDPKNVIFIVHRLDRDVSGIMMFAKTWDVQQKLQNAWDSDVLERKYAAVVEGVVKDDQGTITSWLKENSAHIVYSSHTPEDGRKAVTHYRVLKRSKGFSLLEVSLETGRKNQIRVHMKDIGHSIVGDVKYGAQKKNLGRVGLHAFALVFRHPVTREEMRFETPIPGSFLSLFK